MAESRAIVGGKDRGGRGPLPTQTRLGDLWLPQYGAFLAGDVRRDSLNASRKFLVAAERQE